MHITSVPGSVPVVTVLGTLPATHRDGRPPVLELVARGVESRGAVVVVSRSATMLMSLWWFGLFVSVSAAEPSTAFLSVTHRVLWIHGCDDSSRQDDEPPKRQLVRGAVA